MALSDPADVLTYTQHKRPDPDQLVRAHMGLVRKLAWHVHGRVSNAIDIEDLIQSGMIALIEAARAFENRGHAFATYAGLRIRGAMIDTLRRQATQGRAAMVKRREIEKARMHLERQFGRTPTDVEIAGLLGLDLTVYRAMAEAAQSVRHESIDELYSDHSMWFADAGDGADVAMERGQLQASLANGISKLPKREAMVLQLYFVEEMNLEEVGETLGISPSRVCQIKKSALETLRASIGA
ncbi:FliA/WhiG family RNA polymerase sigma factor (plasmid) [Sphingomonas paeninsulae]|uniref:FliA/WhiG family RNA polymerase sigma factor n=1 Tax=Sphingomonas paeninsulae TaxID=2319844 RepID=A0A494TJB4_SPHPE|nr:FliA/WhiG family RNA polymerase sigma factor [Sphingomonas paeninsulae]AYJ85225.1 FliA/WhiG family RNA polymerase sigma factor [Sphingomonas paeninsulae]